MTVIVERPLLGVPFANIQCPRCRAELTIPIIPDSTRRFGCPMCGAIIECSIDQRGRVKVSFTTIEVAATEEAIEEARQSIEEFKRISGAMFCPKCGADISSAEIQHKVEGTVVKAYTLCSKCGREIEWALVPLGRMRMWRNR